MWRELDRMLQGLLAERFKLTVRREIREVSGYWLVVGKNGPKMQRTPDSDTSRGAFKSLRTAEIIAQPEPIAELALKLSGHIHIPVVDKTDLKGRYNFSLQWSRDELPAAPASRSKPSLSAPVYLLPFMSLV
jgi:uncharacterized protein (TIGR03435 family)